MKGPAVRLIQQAVSDTINAKAIDLVVDDCAYILIGRWHRQRLIHRCLMACLLTSEGAILVP